MTWRNSGPRWISTSRASSSMATCSTRRSAK
uniref:Uncharacterized protein n=1 Tax=Siphoviridae sp. ct0hG5 TaxID=2826269 RepID=A0A8S5QL67_9CAUD|nr:MAG TPA: hypothetical protein [Siphoviridae sp. ct0hG5]